MNRKKKEKEILKLIRTGVRLKTPPPKKETPETVYSRKIKHKRRPDASFDFFTGYCRCADKICESFQIAITNEYLFL